MLPSWETMVEKAAQSDTDREKLSQSIFAKEKTYGEKKYDFIFGNLINFWVNLLASAGFAYWVRHAGPTKLPFSNKTFEPSKVQDGFAKWMENKFSFTESKASSVANILTLLTPGHIVMIPSVYFGEKYKASIVKHFNRRHYGDEAMQSPELMRRHAEIAAADKPTVLGTVVARAGTAVINSSITYTLGTQDNWLRKKGEQFNIPGLNKFRGLDHYFDRMGVAIGEGTKAGAPQIYESLTESFSKNKKYSSEQIANAKKYADADPSLAKINDGQPYKSGFNNFIRYVTQDIIYTLIAAGVVHPIIRNVKKILPGMTYKPKVSAETAALAAGATPPKSSYSFDVPVEQTTAALDTTVAAPTPSADEEKPKHHQGTHKPHPHVKHASHDATLNPRHEHAHHAGA